MKSSKPQFVGKKVTIGELGKTQSGGTPSSKHPEFFNGSIPWIGTTALNGKFLGKNDAVKLITEEAVAKSATKIVPEKSIMVGIRVGVGKVAINAVPMCTSQDIVSIVGIDEASWNKEYISLALQYKAPLLAAQAQGATIAGITSKTLKAIEIPAIPINEQNRVVDILRKLENQVGFVRKQLCGLDALVKSRFVEMFGTPDNNIHSLPIKTMGEISEQLIAGGDKPRKISKNKDLKHPYPVFANGTIADGLQGFSEEARVNKSAVTIAARGTIGFCLVREPGFTPVVRLISLVPKPSINVVYLKYFIDLLNLAGSGSSQAQLTLPAFREQQILVPELKEQLEFSTFVAQVDKSRFGGMLHLLNSLSGIMHASFFSVADTD